MGFSRIASLSLAALASVALLAGCAATTDDESSSETSTEEQDVKGRRIRDVTVVRGVKVRPGQTVTVPYEPSGASYEKDKYQAPYLAIELDDDAEDFGSASPSDAVIRPLDRREREGASTPIAVTVTGDFPGQPHVLVADSRFRVETGTTARTNADGLAEATVLTTGRGKRFVLVRDMLWVKPMTFDVTVER